MKRKKILMVIPSLGFGGAQKVFYNLSMELSRHFEVVECGFNKNEEAAYPSQNEIAYLNVHGSDSYFYKILNFFKRCRRLSVLKQKYHPDFIISHLEGADYINVLASGKGKKILCVHGTKKFDGKIQGFVGFLRKKIFIPFLYSKADHIVTVSKEIKEELVSEYWQRENKITVIHNWFDINSISEKSKESIGPFENELYNKKTIVLSGRFDIQKNFIPFLHVIKKTVEAEKDVKFIFLGDGMQREELLHSAAQLNLRFHSPWSSNEVMKDAQLVFLGYQDNPYKFLKRADMFVLPSSWEGFPMALGEAMACGLPVMAANCPTGPAEMLGFRDGSFEKIDLPVRAPYGILLPMLGLENDSINVWTKSITELLEQKEEQVCYSQKSLERIQEYSREKILKQWTELLNQPL